MRDLTFLPHLLELSKPIKLVTIGDVIGKLPMDSSARQVALLQQQIGNLDLPECYYRIEARLQSQLEIESQRGPPTGRELPIGSSPPEAKPNSENATPQTSPPEGEPPIGGSPPGAPRHGEHPKNQPEGRPIGGPPPAGKGRGKSTPPQSETTH